MLSELSQKEKDKYIWLNSFGPYKAAKQMIKQNKTYLVSDNIRKKEEGGVEQ